MRENKLRRSSNRQILATLEGYGLTEFQTAVLKATLSIPKGETRTYKQIASLVGRPRAYRAVGTALKNNPLPIIIPCHRVIRSDGETGNYNGTGRSGRLKKIKLLKMEGAL
ncbi:MAG: methylated-DNA--protein-cysteine methyltransferase [Candidatus Micrarchaeum acidiphilum ARMAN-2]|jgi:methylated-DNA-[protein]-cysteine S-methyltransferase|uniref:methylated-DNA--[protein]-cysteine S-methyltransferase n=1 Tax=Candidatus Micrarchaeum acidiphilum ARMAN-2 TaxID=425595 RepID=C7DGK7_MICA2|nr:MAG: methylated-DNA--protein-cysteine methyltransferase [Candidatus Micrarchaeum acidiphilum ARMAN-2]